jgi:hypothetical protein
MNPKLLALSSAMGVGFAVAFLLFVGARPKVPVAGSPSLLPSATGAGSAARSPGDDAAVRDARQAARNYVHPTLFGDRASPLPVHPADCSQQALDGMVGLVLALEASARPAPSTKDAGADTSCAPEFAAPARARQDQLSARVSECVARDDALDSAWDRVNSALLAIASCADCGATLDARASACKHARAERGPLKKK